MSMAYLDLDEALLAPLSGDAGLIALLGDNPMRLYATLAPNGDVLPYAVFSVNGASVLNRTSAPELDVTYTIEAYADSREGAQNAQGAIHNAILNTHFVVGGYTCYQVQWLGGRGNALFENGRVIWRMAGEYRLRWVG